MLQPATTSILTTSILNSSFSSFPFPSLFLSFCVCLCFLSLSLSDRRRFPHVSAQVLSRFCSHRSLLGFVRRIVLTPFQVHFFVMKGTNAKAALSKKGEETNLKKKKQASSDEKSKKRQSKKERNAKKDPNKPKRAPSAFFVFLEEFRKTFGASHPNNKSVSVVGKAGGDKWKSMTDAEKAPYIAKATKRKVDYEKAMKAYNSKQEQVATDAGDEESDKSKSEVNDEEDEEEEDDDEE